MSVVMSGDTLSFFSTLIKRTSFKPFVPESGIKVYTSVGMNNVGLSVDHYGPEISQQLTWDLGQIFKVPREKIPMTLMIPERLLFCSHEEHICCLEWNVSTAVGWHLVKIFMFPSGWIIITSLIPYKKKWHSHKPELHSVFDFKQQILAANNMGNIRPAKY